jgi:hypothetical protein
VHPRSLPVGPDAARVYRLGIDKAEPALPGEDLIRQGLEDLAAGVESVESLLVSIGAPRLTGLGVAVENPFASPEHRLYELLSAEEPDSAHSRYNALIRRLVSYESAAESRRSWVNPATARQRLRGGDNPTS